MTKNLQYESGRSMVEMLGTLAIIGVLSVGAIAGYSYGMDKYRCNQTMRDISLRTVDLITQASQGRTTLSLSEWENEDSIYDFSNPAYSDDGLVMFDIGTTKKLPKSVCQMVFEGLSNTAVQIDINGSVATSKDSCSDNNTMTFYFAGGSNASGGTGGETGEQCGSSVCGICQKCDATTETCGTADDYEMKCTTNDNKTGWCISGTCEPDTTCNCGKGYYCADTKDSCEHPTPSGNCVEAEPQFRTVDIDNTTYYISNDPMTWWDAVSACKALGNKKLLSVYDLVEDFDSTSEESCCDTPYTALNKALYEKGWGNNALIAIWTSTIHESCSAYSVNMDEGRINFSANRNSSYSHHHTYAVCK